MKRIIEAAGSLPSYEVNELVTIIAEDVVGEVVGHQEEAGELIYKLIDPQTGETYLCTFSELQPHMEPDFLDEVEDDFMSGGFEFDDYDDFESFGTNGY